MSDEVVIPEWAEPERRWEIVIACNLEPTIVENVLREVTLYIAETLGYDPDTAFDVAAFARDVDGGECFSEYAFPEPGDVSPADATVYGRGHPSTDSDA